MLRLLSLLPRDYAPDAPGLGVGRLGPDPLPVGCGGGEGQGTEPAHKVTAVWRTPCARSFCAKAMRRHRRGALPCRRRASRSARRAAHPNVVTTTTDVWVDKTGNYRFREQNDRDGGREVMLHGRELAGCATLWRDDPPRRRGAGADPVARGSAGRAVRGVRVWWRARARVARAGTELVEGARATVFELSPDARGRRSRGPAAGKGLRGWRDKASIDAVSRARRRRRRDRRAVRVRI